MADAYSIVSDDASGAKIDESELTVNALLVRRQRMILADDTDPLGKVKVTNADPGASDYGAVVRIASRPEFKMYDTLTQTDVTIGMTGTLETGPRTPVFEDDMYLGVDTVNIWTQTIAGGGTVSAASGLLSLSNGATTNNNRAGLLTKQVFGFVTGATSIFRAAVLVDAGTTSNERKWGVWDANNGFFFRLTTSGSFSVVTRKATADTVVAQGSFSEGAYTLDANLHTYEIFFTSHYVIFAIDGVARHRIQTPSAAPLTDTVHLPIQFDNLNTGTAGGVVTMKVRTAALHRLGGMMGVITAPRRTNIILTGDNITPAATDTIIGFNRMTGANTTAIAAATGYPVSVGKTFRITSLTFGIVASSAVAQSGSLIVRIAASGSIATSSAAILRACPLARTAAVINSAVGISIGIPDGIDLPGGTIIGFSGLAETTAARFSFTLTGYEF